MNLIVDFQEREVKSEKNSTGLRFDRKSRSGIRVRARALRRVHVSIHGAWLGACGFYRPSLVRARHCQNIPICRPRHGRIPLLISGYFERRLRVDA